MIQNCRRAESHLPQAIGLLLVNASGIFTIVARLVWLFVAWRKMWQASEGVSLAAVAILILLTFGMGGTGTSDNAHEFIHRPFVWAYGLVASLTAERLFSLLAGARPHLSAWAVAASLLRCCRSQCGMARGYNGPNGQGELYTPAYAWIAA
jgi:hypothetical protein